MSPKIVKTLKINTPDGLVDVNPNTKEGFEVLKKYADYVNRDRAIALLHCLDPNTKYGQRSTSFAIHHIFNQANANAPALITKIDPNTLHGQIVVKALVDCHRNPKKHIALNMATISTLAEKIDPTNIHGSKSAKYLARTGLVCDKIACCITNRPSRPTGSAHDRLPSIIGLTALRVGEEIADVSNPSGHARDFALQRRFALGKVPINTISRR